jgi:hypothetical protein
MSLRRASRSQAAKKTAKKTARKAKKRAAKSGPPRRSLILVLVAAAGVVAAVVAKRAFGGADDYPSPPAVDRAEATWAPQGVQPPIAPEPAVSESNGGEAEATAEEPTPPQ